MLEAAGCERRLAFALFGSRDGQFFTAKAEAMQECDLIGSPPLPAFYVTRGGSYTKINHSFATTNTANSFAEVNDGKMVWGRQGGGGRKIMLTNNLSPGVAYLYTAQRQQILRYRWCGYAPDRPVLLRSGGTNMRPSETGFDFYSLRATVSFEF